MTKILAFSGKKQSGKDTSCNWLFGAFLRYLNLINAFKINESGQLVVNALWDDGEITNQVMDPMLYGNQWLAEYVHPTIKRYSFADELKDVAINVFGVSRELVYGSNEDKLQPTPIEWNSIKKLLDVPLRKTIAAQVRDGDYTKVTANGYVTIRGFLQLFGTEICRVIAPNCWVDSCIRRIEREQPVIAIISDVRFANEVEGVHKAGGKIIRLTRKPQYDEHRSEKELDKDVFDWSQFDHVLDNRKLSIEQQCQAIYNILNEWEYLPFKMDMI